MPQKRERNEWSVWGAGVWILFTEAPFLLVMCPVASCYIPYVYIIKFTLKSKYIKLKNKNSLLKADHLKILLHCNLRNKPIGLEESRKLNWGNDLVFKGFLDFWVVS